MSMSLIFAVPLLVEDIDPVVRDAIHAKVSAYLKSERAKRDIEGENLLYLPQAKVYKQSCALGPWIALGAPEKEAREWIIRIAIKRDGSAVFKGETSVNQIKRSFTDLVSYLFRSQDFPHGAVLLTGTGVVPDDTFTLRAKDVVEIEISGIGLLQNPVAVV